MRHKWILILYFLSPAILILLLGPGYLLSVVQLMQLIKKFNNTIWMPHPTNQNSVVWNTLGDVGFAEIQHFNCPWTITTHNESITVNIIYLKWTSSYDFWIRVEIHPQGNPKASQLLDIDELHPLFKSLAKALLNYYEYPEPHLTEFQLHVYGKSLDHLSYKVDWTTIMATTHLAYPELALDKFSGTDPDQDAESFVQFIERKIKFALGDAPADPDDSINYTFRKKALFSSLLRRPAAEWYEKKWECHHLGSHTREQFITRFSDGRNKFPHRMEVEHCVRGDGEDIRNFLHRIEKKWTTKDGLITWKALQRQVELQNVRHKGDKEHNDTLSFLYEDFAQGTYSEKLKNTWWSIQTELGMTSPHKSSSEMWVTRSPLTSSMMRSRQKFNRFHWDKKWKIFLPSYKNIESTHSRTQHNPILTKMADTTLQGFASIAASTDTLKISVAKEFETKKYDASNMICPSKRMLLPSGTEGLAVLTVNPNRMKTGDRPPDWTDKNNPTNGLTTEREAWQYGSNELFFN